MTSILRALGLDVRRLFSQGMVKAVFFLIGVPAALCLVAAVSAGEGAGTPGGALVGGAVGGIVGVFVIMPGNIFVCEQQAGGGNMNGVIPVRRVGQVAGRYLVMAALALWVFAEAVVCFTALSAMTAAGVRPPESLGAGLAAMFAYMVVESVMFPLLYRFPMQKAWIILYGGCLVIGAVSAALIKLLPLVLPASALAACARAASAVIETLATAEPAGVAFVGVTVTAVAVGVSFVASSRIYRGKEL